MSTLQFNHYGKHMVRLLRVNRDGAATDRAKSERPGFQTHDVAEWETDLVLEGELAGSYLSDDNSSIVPTDTIKNTVLALAHDEHELSRDGMAAHLAAHFLQRYEHISAATVEIRERQWARMSEGGEPHPHAFLRDSNGKPFSAVRQERGHPARRAAGIRGLVMMKTTASGFSGYPRCEFTTLPETEDRIFSTSLDARWEYREAGVDLQEGVIAEMLKVFAGTPSPSVQRTLYQMGEAALAAFSGIESIRLTMPNRHYLNINLTPLKRPADQKRIFLPSDDPFGFIEAVVGR